MSKPLIAVTMGDPAGVGPEIVAKSLASEEVTDVADCVIVGDRKCMENAIRIVGADLKINVIQKPACDPPAAVILLHIHSAYIGRKILTVMKIIFDHSKAACNTAFIYSHIPLRHRSPLAQTCFYTGRIFLYRDPPLFMKPHGSLICKLPVIPQI